MPQHQSGSFERFYIACVVALGGAAILHASFELYQEAAWQEWLPLAALTLLSGSVTIRVPSVGATISVSETFVFTSVLLFGPSAGTVIAALDGLIISLWLRRRNPSLKKTLFNMAAPALSIWVAAVLFFKSADIKPLAADATSVSSILPSLVLLAAVYFLLNSWLMAWAVSFERRVPAMQIWRHDFLWVSLSFFGGASVAALLVSLNRQVTFGAIAVIVPLLIISYLTFKTAFGRIEDATAHLTQLNKLYLSTIETLAMAIDAKDQITHGHIRRVQHLAIGLARVMGVHEDTQIRAIEAAALLHDMGKLAVPEYILNKPGKLTPTEFEKMKLHASVGADILSAIEFPYPVVPIVRHHHENWDGTGYPDRLAGTAIPIGARILSVVDCFDALTSDRPYRPRLTDDEALQILRDRRATMYDPLIVDTFIAVYRDLAPTEPYTTGSPSALKEITRAATPSDEQERDSGLREISSGADEMLTLYGLAHALAGKTEVRDVGDTIAKHLRRMIPTALFVLFRSDGDKDELVAEHATGGPESLVLGLRIGFGQRIAGWVAANKHTIINSDPTLDLGDLARTIKPPLKSCLSAPVVKVDKVVGVISLYSPSESAFTDEHRRLLEAVARDASEAIAQSSHHDTQPIALVREFLPEVERYESLSGLSPFDKPLDTASTLPLSLLFVELCTDHGASNNELTAAVGHAVAAVNRNLRSSDSVFTYSDTRLLVLLRRTDAAYAHAVAERIVACFDAEPTRPIRLRIGYASAPQDGTTLSDLITLAKMHVASESKTRGSSHIH